MRHKILSFFLLSFVVIIPSYAQLSMTNLQRPANFVDVIFSGGADFSAPSEGANQVWDYGDVTKMGEQENTYTADPNNPNFPDALSSYPGTALFNAFPIQITRYLKMDENGLFEIGRTVIPISFSISAISGGENDSLHFPSNHNHFDNCGRAFVTFPSTYLDQWTNTFKRNTFFELSVAAFGLDRTPGVAQATITHSREIVGHGTVIIPKTDGTPSVPIEALLLKINEARVDSYFLNGSPAPDILLDAFGITQGQITEEAIRYCWYNPNFSTAILCMRPNEFFSYRPNIADAAVTTSIRNMEQLTTNYFPNPIAIGQTLTIQTNEAATEVSAVELSDISGRLLYQTLLDTPVGKELQITVPTNFNTGVYFYQLKNEQGVAIGAGKIFVE